jgi:hypothetical protein
MIDLMDNLEIRATVSPQDEVLDASSALLQDGRLSYIDTEMRTASALRPEQHTPGLAAAGLQRTILPLRCASYIETSFHGVTFLCAGLRIHTHASVHCGAIIHRHEWHLVAGLQALIGSVPVPKQ